MYLFDVWTIVLLVFMAPFVMGTVIVIIFYLFKIFRNIYLHIRYGIEHTDQDE